MTEADRRRAALIDLCCGGMIRAIYPTLISKDFITVSPLYCLVVQDEQEIEDVLRV